MSYGLVKTSHARDIARAVCDVLGRGSTNMGCTLLLETAAQETHLGQYRDPTPYGAGTGLCQIDLISFEDIKERTRSKHKEAILEAFGVDLDKVSYQELEHSPLLSFIFCRLHYKLIPEAIPVTLAARADYWKRYYNTSAGKGSALEYVDNAKRYL